MIRLKTSDGLTVFILQSELFQEDLYPDTVGDTPALEAEEWFAGKDSDPVLVSLKGGFTPPSTKNHDFKTTKRPNILDKPSKNPPSNAVTAKSGHGGVSSGGGGAAAPNVTNNSNATSLSVCILLHEILTLLDCFSVT